jgi:prepilin-type N-terminal cleavage/methylation domain-containing protein
MWVCINNKKQKKCISTNCLGQLRYQTQLERAIMNIKQMKETISKFRAADVSIIKDEKLRAKAQKLQAKQGGFTLLELLVVITLLATLATAALVAYDGLGENASEAATANALLAAESAVRNYRAIESRYPNQWDNLANLNGEALVDASGAGNANTNGQLLSGETMKVLGQWKVPQDDKVLAKVAESLAEVGIDEFQTIDVSGALASNIIPNLAFNESGNDNASELELWSESSDQVDIEWNNASFSGDVALSIFPSGGSAGDCDTSGGTTVDISTPFDGTVTAPTDNSALNLINDAIGDDECTLVVALGYGKDVPGTTIDSKVAIAQVPTAETAKVKASSNYARLIALFQVASDGSDGSTADNAISSGEVFSKPRLVGFIDPQGRSIDTVLNAANVSSSGGDDD